jgi:tight adherence protein C
MRHVELVIKYISIVCSFGAFSLFVNWLITMASEAYSAGLAIRGRLNIGGDVSHESFPMASKVFAATTSLLPVVDYLSEYEHLQVHLMLAQLERKLIKAGLRARISPEQFIAFSLLLGTIVGTFLTLVLLLLGASFTVAVVLGTFSGASVGLFAPSIMLDNVIANRISSIEKRLPFAIEFLLLSMEARATLGAAIEIYCSQMELDPLANELETCLRDMRLGMSAQAALSDLARRTQSDDISAFVLAVNSGLDTGQPVKDVLHIQSDVARQRRYHSAEQIAKTASTRAIFPLFIVAMAVVLLLLGPLIIKLSEHSLF